MVVPWFPFLIGTFEKIVNLTTHRVRRQVCSSQGELGLLAYDLAGELGKSIGAFAESYIYQRYHEGLGDVTPYDVCTGRYLETIQRRKSARIKTLRARKDCNKTTRKPGDFFKRPDFREPDMACFN